MRVKSLALTSRSPEETQAIAARLGRSLMARDVLALSGPLGAGKTVFVQGLSRGLGTEPRVLVTSPTFVIIHEYPGRLPLYHFDFYRLGRPEDVEGLGYEEYFEGTGVTAVEWAEKFAGLMPPETLWISLARAGETQRKLEFRPGLENSVRWLSWSAALENRG